MSYKTSPLDWDMMSLSGPVRQASMPNNDPVHVVVGDSRARLFFGTLKGQQAMQYGFPGITIGDLLPRIGAKQTYVTPASGLGCFNLASIVLDVGINDTIAYDQTSQQALNRPADMLNLILGLHAICPRMVIVTPLPYELSPLDPNPAAVLERCATARSISQMLVQLATYWHIPYVDINASYSNADGSAKAGTTCDGAHYSQTMRAAWNCLVSAQLPT